MTQPFCQVMTSQCGCRGGKEQSGVWARDSRGAAREEKAAQPREAKAQQDGIWSGVSQMVTYLICDLRKEFFKRVQARFR